MKMDKEEFNEKTYKDEQGYLRWKDSKKRVSRTIAYKEIYLKNKKKYPLNLKIIRFIILIRIKKIIRLKI